MNVPLAQNLSNFLMIVGGDFRRPPCDTRCKVCNTPHMATNLGIDEALLEEALRIGGQRTKKATVTEALEEYIQRRRQAAVLKLFGKLEMHAEYDYKQQRRHT